MQLLRSTRQRLPDPQWWATRQESRLRVRPYILKEHPVIESAIHEVVLFLFCLLTTNTPLGPAPVLLLGTGPHTDWKS